MAGASGARAAGRARAPGTLTFPAASDPARPPGGARGPAPPAGRDGEPPPVLVVDDDRRMLRFVRDPPARAGHALPATGDPGELAQIVRTQRPRLVPLDPTLPGADGSELMETVARALAQSAADTLVRPISATELTARIQAALRKRAGSRPANGSTAGS